MPSYTVPLQGGGAMTVNASDPGAAATNVIAQGGMPAGNGNIVQVGGTTNAPQSTVNNNNNSSAQLMAGVNSLIAAISAGDKKAFDEAVRQFDLTFGLDKDKFQESIRQFNVGVPITEANLTGMYQGNQTLAAQAQNAQLYGNYGTPTPGQSTLAAQQQQYGQQLGLINQAAQLQANPFRQQQALGQMSRLLGGQGVAGFQAPNAVGGVGTVGGNTQGGMGYLQQMMDDINAGGAYQQPPVNQPNVNYQAMGAPQPAGVNQAAVMPGPHPGYNIGPGGNLQRMVDDIRNPTANAVSPEQILNAMPTPNKLDSVSFLRAAPSTQNMVLQGMQEKYGLDPADALKQIQNTMPTFRAPTTFGAVRR